MQVLAANLAQASNVCNVWCAQNFLKSGLSKLSPCVTLSAKRDGPCYTCGPYKTSQTRQLCSGSCSETKTDRNNCGKCGSRVSWSHVLSAMVVFAYTSTVPWWIELHIRFLRDMHKPPTFRHIPSRIRWVGRCSQRLQRRWQYRYCGCKSVRPFAQRVAWDNIR